MIRPDFFVRTLADNGMDFFAGVPDSLLKNVCAYITDHVPPHNNIIAANEGGAIGMAAGYHLATGRTAVVYMQNSGEGNAVNPLLSLTDGDVYRMPVLLVIGWRGQPGVHDEPQHVKQGKVTLALLDAMGIAHDTLSMDEAEAKAQIETARAHMDDTHEAYALIVRKGTFADYQLQRREDSGLAMTREAAIGAVADAIEPDAVIVSTTGMASRELFEHRARTGQGHERDFLTVGSMGHASQIALGIALQKPDRRIYCLDGDGAAIMHMGGMAIVGDQHPANYVHILLNNGAHDSVGGQPTVGLRIDFPAIARALGYHAVYSVDSLDGLRRALPRVKAAAGPVMLEVKVRRGARPDLGRPTTTPVENKMALMQFLSDRP